MSQKTMTQQTLFTDGGAEPVESASSTDDDAGSDDVVSLLDFWDAVESISETRSTNAKQDTVERIMAEWPQLDAHLAIRYFVGSPFADPGRQKEFGTKHLFDAYLGTHTESEADVRERKNQLGDVSLLWPVRDSGSPISLRHAHAIVDEAWEHSGNAATRFLGTEIQRVDTPRALAWMFVNDMSLGMGSAIVRKAMASHFGVDDSALKRAHGAVVDIGELFVRLDDGDGLPEVHPSQRVRSHKPKNQSIPLDGPEADDWVGEVKYDGARVRVHREEDGTLKCYMGGSQEFSSAVPELLDVDWPDAAFIVDGEIVAYEAGVSADAAPLPFQNVMKRITRKNGVADTAEKIELRFKLFDCLYFDRPLVDEPYQLRHAILEGEFPDSVLAHFDTDVEACFEWALENGHEGAIAKHVDSRYHFSRTSRWRKWKPNPETLDLRIRDVKAAGGDMAGMMGALVVETADGHSLGSVGTGFSDSERCDLLEQHEEDDSVAGRIVEIESEELQPSSSGFGLRFPSFKAFRPDGEPDSLDRIKHIFEFESGDD